MLLLACCLLLLLAAKPGRSTLDTKKGYKTKTGSTSSVTLALTVALALTPEGGQGEVTGACAPPPSHHHPKLPHLGPPPHAPPDTPPHRPSLNPPLQCPPPPPPPQGAFGPLLLGGGSRVQKRGDGPPVIHQYMARMVTTCMLPCTHSGMSFSILQGYPQVAPLAQCTRHVHSLSAIMIEQCNALTAGSVVAKGSWRGNNLSD